LPGYSELISRLAHANDLSAISSASRSILGDMESHGLQPDNATFLALIRGCAGAGELTTASKYLERMLKLGNRKPRLRSFTPLLHAAYRREDLPFAVDTWRLMQQHGVAPSEAEVASLLALLVKKGQQQTSLDKDGDELLWAEAADALIQNELTAASRLVPFFHLFDTTKMLVGES
jgi:pentatricopeptide repeat protein